MSDAPFLSRWSRLKQAAKAGPDRPTAAAVPAEAGTQSSLSPPVEPQSREQPPAPLPPLESLTPESDFTPFMKAEVDPATRRQALKALFQDPQFNVMDGLDTYIADYSLADPLPEGWLEKMTQTASLGDVFARREQEEKEAAQALAARSAAQNPDGILNPPEAPAVPSLQASAEPEPVHPIEGMPTRTG